MHYMHAACALRMQFMLMHAVHGMKCRAFSMLCWGYTRRTSLKTSILSLLHDKTIDLAASSGQTAAFGNKSPYLPRISWGALGALLGALGPLLAALGSLLARHAKIINKSMPKMTDLSSQEGGQMPPKSIQKATENRCKDETPKKHS